jgi:hypothetical protein
LLVAGALLAIACSVRDVQRGATLDRRSLWVLLPLSNQSEAAQAGEKAEAILGTLLRARGLSELAPYRPPAEAAGEIPELDDRRRAERAQAWARAQGFTYAVTGSVEEWRYRNGLNGEPAVGLTVMVVDLTANRVAWSASGARAGWGRDTLAGTAQVLLKSLLSDLSLR